MSDLVLRLTEAWGDIVAPDATFDGVEVDWAARRSQPYSKLYDRSDGRYMPVYETEIDLKAIRAACRLMAERVPMAKSITNGLLNYTISSGFDWKVAHPSPRYQSICEAVLKAFNRDAQWQSHQERESFIREVEEGEFIAELTIEGPDIGLEPLEGDNLTEPLSPVGLEEWLEIDYPVSWSFGIAARENRWRPLFYHIVRNEAGTDFDCVRPRNFIHWRRNVPVTAKRGFSDFYRIYRYLGRADKVVDNVAIGAAIQAAIAYIVEHVEGTTKSGVEAVVNSLRAVTSQSDPIVSGGTYRRKPIIAGQRLDIPANMKYHAGLFGSNNSQIYIQVMEALLRLAATSYHFPEHMITGYAGNNNMASSLVAESPFVQGRLADQAIRASRTESLFMSVLESFFCSRWALSRGYNWEDARLGLEVLISKPQIVTRDPGALTATLISQHDKGWVSARTAAQELGRDYETEQANIAEENGQTAGGAAGTGEFSTMSRLQQKRNQAGIRDTLTDYVTGKINRAHAEVLLGTLGLSPDNAAQLLDSADGSADEKGQGLSESVLVALLESTQARWRNYP